MKDEEVVLSDAQLFADLVILSCDYDKVSPVDEIENMGQGELRIYVCKDKGKIVVYYFNSNEIEDKEFDINVKFSEILDWLCVTLDWLRVR